MQDPAWLQNTEEMLYNFVVVPNVFNRFTADNLIKLVVEFIKIVQVHCFKSHSAAIDSEVLEELPIARNLASIKAHRKDPIAKAISGVRQCAIATTRVERIHIPVRKKPR